MSNTSDSQSEKQGANPCSSTITAEQIREVRNISGAGLRDCRMALEQGKNIQNAIELLRMKGRAIVMKTYPVEYPSDCPSIEILEGGISSIELQHLDVMRPDRPDIKWQNGRRNRVLIYYWDLKMISGDDLVVVCYYPNRHD